MENQVRVLGVLCIAVGALNGLASLFQILFFGGADTIAGYFFSNTTLATVWLIAALVLMLPGIVIGIGLVGFRGWARWAGIILAIFEMIVFPLGAAVGIYGLVVLFSEDVDMIFSRRYGEYVSGRR